MAARQAKVAMDRHAEAARVERLRRDARRPMAVNLAEGIALSHFLLTFVGAARRR